MNHHIYIAACDKQGGIYHYILTADGHLEFSDSLKLDRPMYMTISDNIMHIILRAPFEESEISGLAACEMDSRGKLSHPSAPVSTEGKCACHLCVCDNKTYVVNYLSGNVISIPGAIVQHTGCSINKARQEAPHTHYVSPAPDNKYICVTDLGTDKIHFYNKDLTRVSEAEAPKGFGPRHLVFKGDYMYCANELDSSVSVYKYSQGKAELLDFYPCIPENFTEKNTAAAIRVDENKLYVSNRGHNSVAVFRIDADKLIFEEYIDVYGEGPRDFDIFGNYIIVTNEQSNNAVVIDKNTHKCLESIELPAPLCVIGQNPQVLSAK